MNLSRCFTTTFVSIALLAAGCGGGDEPITAPGGTGTDAAGSGPGAGVGSTCTNECSTNGAKRCDITGVQACGNHDQDDCLEWSASVPCAQGQSCTNGVCVVGCQHECTTQGAKRCQRNGVQTCGNSDADECLEWGVLSNCGQGQSCSNGICSVGCSEECTTVGAKRCDGNGTQTCGEFDGDTCLEWSDTVPCGQGQSCSTGQCGTGCVNECTTSGAKRCSGNGSQACGDFDNDACLEWNTVQPCEGNQTCSNGNCSTDCRDECTTQGAKRCEGNGFQACGEFDADDCLEWGSVVPCGTGESCSNGTCSVGCDDECTTDGAKQCQGEGNQICSDHDADVCLEWGTISPCETGQTCSGGVCAVGCLDECSTSGARRCEGNGAQSCGNFDGDTCLEWSTTVPCAEGQTCSGGACAIDCISECTVVDARKCEGNGTQSCGNFDGDSCLEWNTPTPCADGQVCSAGYCAIACTNECTVVGVTTCEGNGVRTCGDFNTDGCNEFGSVVPCGDGQTCSSGVCAQQCLDECDADGVTECTPTGVRACGNHDNDSCLEWGTSVACPEGETCSSGVCSAVCSNECDAADTVSCDGFFRIECGEFDDDECLDQGTPQFCGFGFECQDGACIAVSGDLTCVGIYDCLVECPDDDNGNCALGCLNSGTPSAQTDFEAFDACVAISGCEDGVCYAKRCSNELAQCFFPVTGATTCADVFDCMLACPVDDDACGEACITGGDRPAQSEWIQFATCVNSECPDDAPVGCFDTVAKPGGLCGVASARCIEPDGEGTDCVGLSDCVNSCEPGIDACFQSCDDGASRLGLAEGLELEACVGITGCADDRCVGDFCAAEYAQCVTASHGVLTCPEIAECAESCAPEDPTCVNGCLEVGTFVAQTSFVSLVLCIQDECPDGEESCVSAAQQDACSGHLADCFFL